jgi:hypothetical protein
LLKAVQAFQRLASTNINSGSASLGDLQQRTYLTVADESIFLPNSRQELAGDNVSFDDSVAGQRTVDVPLNQEFLTGQDETATLPNSRELLAGLNITFDDTVPNERTINVSVATIDHVVLSDGGIPTAVPVNDGAGNFIYIPYVP